MKNEDDKKINTGKLNQLISLGNNIGKVLYTLFIILLIYVITLIFSEWKILAILACIILYT